MERYVCAHCGHRFEKEPAETVICPHCFWSTSVKKEEEKHSVRNLENPIVPPLSQEPHRIWLWGGGTLLVALVFGVSLFAFRHLRKQDEILRKIQSKNARIIATQAPELNLSAEEREILNRKIALDSVRSLTEEELRTLAPRFTLRSRLPQGVATPPWDEQQFDGFLKEVQAQYRMPLEWTYRRKLTRLFREHYLVASQAFEAKDFLKARDEWIRSLVFPIYHNDPRKHQGVILTMLRPYINDLLSKIGAMNTSLTGLDRHVQEEKLRSAYQNLTDLIQKQSWEEANAKILEISKQIDALEKAPGTLAPPPLPDDVSQTDPDIRQVLITQTAPSPSSLPDLTSLRQDLTEKEKVIQSRMPEALEAARRQYQEALGLIQEENWQAAGELLRKIDFPKELREDAQAKVRILDKILTPSLDSQKDSG